MSLQYEECITAAVHLCAFLSTRVMRLLGVGSLRLAVGGTHQVPLFFLLLERDQGATR